MKAIARPRRVPAPSPAEEAQAEAEAAAARAPLPPLERVAWPAIDYAELEAAMRGVDKVMRKLRQ